MPIMTVVELENLIAKIVDNDPTLANLNLNNRQINDEQMTKIAAALSNNRVVKILNLNNNPFRIAGAEAVAEMLKNNSTIRAVNLTFNMFWQGRDKNNF